MAGGWTQNAGRSSRVLHGPLQDGLVQMVPPPLAARLVHVTPRRGKDPLPPVPSASRAASSRDPYSPCRPGRQLARSTLRSFTRSSAHSSSRSPAPYIRAHQPHRASQPRQQRRHLVAGQHDGEADRPLRGDDVIHPGDPAAKHHLVEEGNGALTDRIALLDDVAVTAGVSPIQTADSKRQPPPPSSPTPRRAAC